MRFLCLPGAYSSSKNFEVQLAPFCKELTSDNSASFVFTQGTVPCTPPSGYEDYFGPGPYYKFFEYDGIQQNDVLERVRDFPEGENAEDVLRELMPSGDVIIQKTINRTLDSLYHILDTEGPFDGICAYSEGTVIAGMLIMDEVRRQQAEGRPRQIKRAVFFAGWPPLDVNSNDMMLSDTSNEVIDIPTLHCLGAGDPYLAGGIALYNICDPDEAILFDHGKGHTIPRDATTLRELGNAVRSLGKAGSGSDTSDN